MLFIRKKIEQNLQFIYFLLTDIFAFINNDLKKGGRLIPNKLGLVLVQGQFNFVMSQHLFLQCFDVNLVLFLCWLLFFSSHMYSSHFCLFSRIPSKSMVGWSSLQFKLTLKDNAIIESPWGNCTKTLLSLLKFF